MAEIAKEIEKWQSTEAQETLKKCGMCKGMDVIDFGCGALYWTIPAVHIVGEEGTVYAIDADKCVIEFADKTCKQQGISNLVPIRMKNDKMFSFDQYTDFIMYYDIFHSMGPTMESKILANIELMKEFNRLLRPNGILTVAVFNEICSVQDAVNGPFTAKGRPKWFQVDYKKGLELYGVINLIEGCGFKLINTITDSAVHFDEIEKHIDQPEIVNLSFDELERRDIWVFKKK